MHRNGIIGITGATGFIGQALVRQLRDAGYTKLRLFSRNPTAVIGGQPVEVLHPDTDLSGVDTLIHLAADLGRKPTDRASIFEANVTASETLARQALSGGVKRLVFVSSLGVHGKSSADPIRPESPLRPQTPYSESKAAAERVLLELTDGSPMGLTIVRPAMVYGPQKEGSFAALVKLAKTGLPLPFARALAPRSICSLENAASALVSVATGAVAPAVLLVADPSDSSTRAMLQAIRQAKAGASPLVPFPPGMIARALRLFGKGDMAASLFEPMHIDRTHWQNQSWRPVEDGESAMMRTARAVA